MGLIFAYIVVASIVVSLSIKASNYVDFLDRNTKLSGAFLGGVLLSAVTSLPELITSISSILLINKPSLCIGNILGSNLFNLAVLATVGLFSIRHFAGSKISQGNIAVALFVTLIYGASILNWFNIINFEIATINTLTIIILLLYVGGVKFLARDNNSSETDECEICSNKEHDTVRKTTLKFIATSIGIVISSIVMTYISDDLAIHYNIGLGLCGAIFLGVATSLPEVSSTIALFRLRNYNAAVGNIIGSNLFNFLVLCIVDLFSFSINIYDFSDPKVENLLTFGAIATIATLYMLQSRKSYTKILCIFGAIACYIAFLMVD